MKIAVLSRGKYLRTKEHREKMHDIKKDYVPTNETREKLSKKIKWMYNNDEEYMAKWKLLFKKILEERYG